MRWRDVAVVAGLVAVAGAALAGGPPVDARIAAVDKTERILDDKIEARTAALRARVRALYKLTRPGTKVRLVDPAVRADVLRRRAAARRILHRDVEELAVLRRERDAVARARRRVVRERSEATGAPPPPRSLRRPVPGPIVTAFGRYRGRRTRTRLLSRGVQLATAAGAPVVAPHDGVVRYAGPVRGIDNAVVIERVDGLRSVVGKLAALDVRAGQRVTAGSPIGRAASNRVYVEVRIAAGAAGWPVDPGPLLSAR
ncbi:MAG: M23 family metallopeptidase [Deltaproteobacteria bacterium]|nr:MAG: M23 family metallopeptidase [Deltaproteobacteria bacterium]